MFLLFLPKHIASQIAWTAILKFTCNVHSLLYDAVHSFAHLQVLNELVRIADATFERTRLEALDIHQTETSIATPIEWLTQPRWVIFAVVAVKLYSVIHFDHFLLDNE